MKNENLNLKLIFFAIIFGGIFGLMGRTWAVTYYISSSTGNDANTGLDKNHAWEHAPGMKAAIGNPADYAPPAGLCSTYTGTCASSCASGYVQLYPAGENSSQFSDCSAAQICCVSDAWLSGNSYLLSQPGDNFIFKGCDVWTAENFPWRISAPHFATETGAYYSAAMDYLGTGREEAKISLLGDDDKTWYNSAKCASGWDRPVLDACAVEAPPIPSPYHDGEFMTGCSGNNLTTFSDDMAMLHFPIKNVIFSGFDIRNIYVPNQQGYGAVVYGGRQETAWLIFRRNYIHAWYADPPVKIWVTIPQDSHTATVISGNTDGVSNGMPFQIMGTYQVIPASNNGPIVANWNGTAKTFDITDGYANLRNSCLLHGLPNSQGNTCVDGGYLGGDVDCSQAPGCLLVGGSQAMVISPIQSYPNNRDVTFEENVVDGRDSNLVQEELDCPSDVWGACMGVNGGLYQGPQIVRNNVFRDTTSWYLGMVQEFTGNYYLGPHRTDINTTSHDNMMESLGDHGFGAVVANNVMVGAKAGVSIMLAARKKYTSTASVSTGSSVLQFSQSPATACGEADCELTAGRVIKVVGGGAGGSDLDTYVLSINASANTVTLEDPVQITSVNATIYTGGVNPSYAFNNVLSDVPQNYVFQITTSGGSTTGSVYLFNNTIEGGPDPNGYSPGSYPVIPGTGCSASMQHCEFRNNLLIACSGDGEGSAQCDEGRPFVPAELCGANCTEHANIGQALNQAIAQGTIWNQNPYTFFPSAASPVIGAGDNLTAYCSRPRLSELCSDTTYAVGYDQVNHQVILPARTVRLRPASGAWDVGAYDYQTGDDFTAPGAPVGLAVS
ncbi:MAG: hypothetical protein WC848_06075 [Parcubacteria group bacterium]|jgi:hypothetical protein